MLPCSETEADGSWVGSAETAPETGTEDFDTMLDRMNLCVIDDEQMEALLDLYEELTRILYGSK
ncbi:MAG: hypothetical protein WAM14_06335 [Candidatus Nitrosopolaris sp.]